MAVKVSRPVITAAVIFFALLAYFGVRSAFRSDDSQAATSETSASAEDAKPVAAVQDVFAETHSIFLNLKGRTEPDRLVTVRAETAGTVVNAPVDEGTVVSRGQTLCGLDIEARQARVDEARAAVDANRVEYDAARELADKGWTSPNRATAAKASLDAALAALNSAQVEIRRTQIKAPFEGVFETRLAEAGDFLSPGGACGVLVDLDPIVVAVDVSEEDASRLSRDMSADVRLAKGDVAPGTVRFVGRTADNATRTFRVEIEMPNPDYTLTAGVSASVRLAVAEAPAVLISPALLVLGDDGRVGLRHVDENGVVRFTNVTIIDDQGEGVWVTGLPESTSILTAGQDFLRDGTEVEIASAGEF